MARTPIDTWLGFAEAAGIYTYVLPFLVTFVVVYGIMEKVEPFGSGQGRVHAAFGLLVGAFLVAFAPGSVLGSFFTNFFGAVSVALVGLLVPMILYGLVFGQPSADSGFVKGLAAIGATVGLALFIAWGGFALAFPRDFFLYDIRVGRYLDIILVVAVLGLVGWALLGGDEAGQ